MSNEILPQLVYSLSEQNRFYKQAAAFVLRAVAKHSPPSRKPWLTPGRSIPSCSAWRSSTPG